MNLEAKTRKKIVQAINDFSMIEDGDKIILGVSGGKDSMLLAYMLSEVRKRRQNKFEIRGVYIYKKFLIRCEVDFKEKEEFFKKIGIPLETVEINLPENSKLNEGIGISCQRCSYARRIAMMKLATKRGFNKIAFGHHMDDEVITLFMNILEGRRFKIMDPVNKMDKMNITFIRPLSYIREKEIIELCKTLQIPFTPCLCPVGEQGRRKEIKILLDEIEKKEDGFIEKTFSSVMKDYKNNFRKL